MPMMTMTPARPRSTPTNLRAVAGSWRVMPHVSRNVKIGESEFSTVARLESIVCTAQAMRIHGITQLKSACTTQLLKGMPERQRVGACRPSSISRRSPPKKARSAPSVSGGIVSTPILNCG